MIISIDIINQPYSGEFDERIYDIQNPWSSDFWTYVKFTNDDYSEWCGVSRGSSRRVKISRKRNSILILTSDYLWKLDAKNGNV